MKMFKDGTQLFNNEISPLYDALNRQCVADPSHKWLEQLAAIDASIAKLAKPDDKRQLVEYMAVLRPWVENKVKNVPGVGTWADAQAAVQAMLALAKVAPPPVGTSSAELKAMIAYAVKQRTITAKVTRRCITRGTTSLAARSSSASRPTCFRSARNSSITMLPSRRRSPYVRASYYRTS